MTITLGSLFDGIGVFPLVASRHGITPIWASEIVPDAISITKRHFPEMEHLGDITKLDGGKIPAVHVITFGGDGRARVRIAHFDGAAGFLVHPVQIGLGIRNFWLNLKNVCTDGICQIFSNFCGDTAGRKVSDKSFTHDNALPLDNFV